MKWTEDLQWQTFAHFGSGGGCPCPHIPQGRDNLFGIA
jgi:hypothetical protein